MFARRTFILAVAVVVGLLSMVGSARGDEPAVVIQGFGRMKVLAEKLRDRYVALHPEARIEVQEASPDAAVAGLGEGSCAIAALPRVARQREIKYLRHHLGEELVGIPVAMDAIVFFVHPNNPLDSLTLDVIRKIHTGELTEWRQMGIYIPGVDPELFKKIRRPYPHRDHGHYDMLETLVMRGKAIGGPKEEFPDTDRVAGNVMETPTALGVGGMDHPQDEGIKVLGIRRDEASPVILPTTQTIQDRTYPLAHYVYWYFAGRPTAAARDFLKFAVSPAGQEVVREAGVRFVPLPLAQTSAEGE